MADAARCPFPDKNDALKMLQRDYVFGKINKEDIPLIIEDAWSTGEKAAEDFLAEHAGKEPLNFREIMRESGIRIITENRDFVSGRLRYFADYQPKANKVTLYRQSIEIWARHYGYDYEQACNLILMHEYFHYLEHTKLGYTSRHYSVHMLSLFGIKIGKTGIGCLCEIAADAFARKLYKHALLETETREAPAPDPVSAEDLQEQEEKPQGGELPDERQKGFIRKYGTYTVWSLVITAVVIVFNCSIMARLPEVLAFTISEDSAVSIAKWVYLPMSAAVLGLFSYFCFKKKDGRRQILITQALLSMVHAAATMLNL